MFRVVIIVIVFKVWYNSVNNYAVLILTAMNNIVNELLTKIPFAHIPYENKLQIVNTCRSQSSLLDFKVNIKKRIECTQHVFVNLVNWI